MTSLSKAWKQARNHKAKQAAKAKEAEQEAPYKHEVTHSRSDALNMGPQNQIHKDKIIEANEARMKRLEEGLVADTLPHVMDMATSLRARPSMYSAPVCPLPRGYSYSSIPSAHRVKMATLSEVPEPDGPSTSQKGKGPETVAPARQDSPASRGRSSSRSSYSGSSGLFMGEASPAVPAAAPDNQEARDSSESAKAAGSTPASSIRTTDSAKATMPVTPSAQSSTATTAANTAFNSKSPSFVVSTAPTTMAPTPSLTPRLKPVKLAHEDLPVVPLESLVTEAMEGAAQPEERPSATASLVRAKTKAAAPAAAAADAGAAKVQGPEAPLEQSKSSKQHRFALWGKKKKTTAEKK
ncbi:hypothetical protein GGR56DRAFT_685647 [Xylariaceae sp. FL0804]|nr:hypothetical protein GGR56DRAFT_685647 [Xylariaceae sp. FL0804]